MSPCVYAPFHLEVQLYVFIAGFLSSSIDDRLAIWNEEAEKRRSKGGTGKQIEIDVEGYGIVEGEAGVFTPLDVIRGSVLQRTTTLDPISHHKTSNYQKPIRHLPPRPAQQTTPLGFIPPPRNKLHTLIHPNKFRIAACTKNCMAFRSTFTWLVI